MSEDNSYVMSDQHGVLRVAGTRISIDSVVIAFQQGDAAEEIQRNFPALTLEQVYGTITHYLGHRHEIDRYLHEQRGKWEKHRTSADQNPSDVLMRLRQARLDKAGQAR